MSRSNTKVHVISAKPSNDQTLISSMPLTEEMASSSGKTTPVTTSSGVAPGRRTSTFTVAGSAFGKKSTARPGEGKKPQGTRNKSEEHTGVLQSRPQPVFPLSPGKKKYTQSRALS